MNKNMEKERRRKHTDSTKKILIKNGEENDDNIKPNKSFRE